MIDLSAVPDMEVTAVLLVDDLDRDLAALGIELWLCSVIERPLVMLHRSGTADRLHDRLFSTVGEAVEHFSRHQDMDDVSEPDR